MVKIINASDLLIFIGRISGTIFRFSRNPFKTSKRKLSVKKAPNACLVNQDCRPENAKST